MAVPPLPVLSVLFEVSGSVSSAETLALLSNAPGAVIVAVTVIVTFAPEASDAIVHGSAAQPPPLTFVIDRFVGVSVTWTFVAVDGPALALLSKAPAAGIVAVTVMVVFAPLASEAIVHGSAAQPPPLTFVIDRFVGVSVTWMFVAVDGPELATKSV